VPRSPYVAGIVPVAGQKLDFDFPWHDSLQPIAPDYLAVERAVVECAQASCRTIWIVCHDDMQPLIRYRLGDFLSDPTEMHRSRFAKKPGYHKHYIPIFYVPIHPKDRKKRDCLGWSVLHGALAADSASRSISKWATPSKFYVAFPYGVYNAHAPFWHRKRILGEGRVFISHEGKTVTDGEYLGFTLTLEDVKIISRQVRKEGTVRYSPDQPMSERKYGIYADIPLPSHERNSARNFPLDYVFRFYDIKEEEKIEIPWYHNIGSWDGLCTYLGSEERKLVERPRKSMMSYHELNPIGGEFE